MVSGKFAQIGLLEQFGGEATASDYSLALRYLVGMGCAYLRNQEFGTYPRASNRKFSLRVRA